MAVLFKRLDRAVSNSGWCDSHKSAGVQVMATRASDYNPLLINFNTKLNGCRRGRRSFKFEASWMHDNECNDIIKTVWDEGGLEEGAMRRVRRNLEQCQSKLKSWSIRKYGCNEDVIKEKTKVLAEL